MKNSRLLGIILVMQALVLLGQWVGPATLIAPARADSQLPNPGERQVAMVEELRALNDKMDKLLSLLQGGEVQIRVAKPDEGNKAGSETK
jgi:hypothetical protein